MKEEYSYNSYPEAPALSPTTLPIDSAPSPSDVVLVQQACHGDKNAFAELWNRYRNRLYRIIFFMVHHEEDSWDLLQETFIKGYQALSTLKNAQIVGSWLTRIAVNLAINHKKKKERMRKHQEELVHQAPGRSCTSPQQTIEQQEIKTKLEEIISQLPPKQRTVLILSDVEEYSYKEIAEILQCRIGTVMSRLFYARNFVRKHLESSDIQPYKDKSVELWAEETSLEEEWD